MTLLGKATERESPPWLSEGAERTGVPAAPKARAGGLQNVAVAVIPIAVVLITFLFWYSTWFGRPLPDREMARYLADTSVPHRTQHALAQVADQIARGDSSARRWYPQVIRLAGDWRDYGFATGQTLLVQTAPSGSGLNDGTYHITAVSGDGKTLTLATTDPRVTATRLSSTFTFYQETHTVTCGSSTCTITHNHIESSTAIDWTTNTTFAVGQQFRVIGGANDGALLTFREIDPSNSRKILVDEAVLADGPATRTLSMALMKRFDEDVIELTPQKSAIVTTVTFGVSGKRRCRSSTWCAGPSWPRTSPNR